MYPIFEHYLLGEHAYTATLMPVCEKYDLTYTELSVLLFLENNPTLNTASDIVRCRNFAKSHVSVSVRSLEKRQLLRKELPVEDRRSVCLYPTEQATPIIADGRQVQRHFGERLLNGVSEEERALFVSVLKKIDHNIKQYASAEGEN